jgi:hypothetical protein
MSQPHVPPVKFGDVLRLGEADYRYGTGFLVLRVSEVLDVQLLNDGPWVNVRGVELRPDGSPGEQRQALVRVAALHNARRRPGPGRS